MGCKYVLEGRTFDNIEQLDDFLLSRYKYFNKFGDAVFSVKMPMSSMIRYAQEYKAANNVIEKIRESNEKGETVWIRKRRDNELSRVEMGFDADETLDPEYVYSDEYVGVTTAIQMTVDDVTGDLLVPQFVKDNYFNTLYEQFSQKNFGDGSFWKEDDIIMLFGKGSNDYRQAVNNAMSMTLTDDLKKKIRTTMEAKWKYQAKRGNAIHDVLQAYFTAVYEDPDTKKKTLVRYLPKEQRADALLTTVRKRLFYTGAYFGGRGSSPLIHGQSLYGIKEEDLSDEDIRSLCTIAEGLYDSILNSFGVDENGKEDFTLFAEFPVMDDEVLTMMDYETKAIKKRKIVGALDLMIVDKNGVPHIIDFKTSTHDYMKNGKEAWSSVKMDTYTYQLGLYKQMLARKGINTTSSGLYIAPIVIGGITMEEDSKGNLVGFHSEPINPNINTYGLRDVTGRIMSSYNIRTKINRILPPPVTIEIEDEEHLIENVKKDYDALFGEYEYSNEQLTDEYIAKQVRHYCAFDKRTKKWVYYVDKAHKQPRRIGTKRVMADDEIGIAKAVKDYLTDRTGGRQAATGAIVDQIRKAKLAGENYVQFDAAYKTRLNALLGKYFDDNWTVPEGQDKMNAMGFIQFHNKVTGQKDILCITNIDPYEMRRMKKGELLSANLYGDITETSKNSKMLAAAEGNFEMMRAMTMLNRMGSAFDDGSYIGSIRVFDVESGRTMYASNSQLKYSFTTIAKKVKDNNGKQVVPVNHKVKLADDKQIVLAELMGIQERLNREKKTAAKIGKGYHWSDMFKFKDVRNTTFFGDEEGSWSSVLNRDGVTKSELQKGYENILETLSNYYPELKKVGEGDFNTLGENDDMRRLFVAVSNAVSELNGINVNQQLFESNKYSQFGFLGIFRKGFANTSLDNPGMMHSQLLNSVTTAFYNAYQAVRDRMVEPLSAFDRLERRMVEAVGKSNMMFVDREKIWEEFYERDSDGNISEEFRFVHPEDVEDPVKREILRDLLVEINRYRFWRDYGMKFTDENGEEHETKKLSKEEIERLSDREEYYNVPVVRKQWVDDTNTVHNNGSTWIERLKSAGNTISSMKNVREYLADRMNGNNDKKDRMRKGMYNDYDIFNMSTNLAVSDHMTGIDRIEAIRKIGLNNLTFNAALLGATKAYDVFSNKEINRAMLLAKCAIMHLRSEGQLMDFKYENDIDYLVKYIKGTIKGEDLNDPALRGLEKLVGNMSRFASFMVLGLSPTQFTYQHIQGLMQNAVVTAKKALGDKSFGKEEFFKAAGEVYADVTKDETSKVALFNRMEGINDMDMNDYVKHAMDRRNVRSAEGAYKLCMMTSSRPDYYNRMTIFVAQAMKDGVWDAYERTSDGRLVYHFEQDARFSKLRGDNQSRDSEYYKQLGTYKAMADRMIVEDAVYATDVTYIDEHGNLQKIDAGTKFADKYVEGKAIPLPKAYTSQQSEGYKNIADDVYGYYSHEKKAAIHSWIIGKMFMQFKTYFSGKKNQYLMSGGVRMRGSYEQYRDNDGNLVFMRGMDDALVVQRKAEDGTLTYHDIDTGERLDVAEDGLIPFYQWKGQYQEGIVVTIANILKMAIESEDPPITALKNAIKQYETNEYTRDVFYTNKMQFLHDITIMTLISGIAVSFLTGLLDDLFKENEDIPGALQDASRILVKSLDNSSMDANIVNTFWSFFGNWTPFTVTYMGRTVSNVWGTISGNKNAFDAACSQFSGLNQIKNTVSELWEE